MDCICLKRKHRKRRDQRKFRPLSPGVSPSHSQPSTLGHAVPEGRLPKVNSTGLWIGTPGLYAGAPSQAYFYGRPPGKAVRDDRPLHIPRAVSETRLPQPMPMHPGAQRFYHSQQLAPVFEVPPSTGMEIYDVYQFGGGYGNGAPRSKLLETKHSPYYYNNISSHNHNLTGEFSLRGSRLERSQSDAQDRSSPRRGGHRRQGSKQSTTTSSSNGKAGSREKLSQGSRASDEARRKRASKSVESLRENGAAVPVIPVSSGEGSRASSKVMGESKRPPSTHSSNGAHVNAGFTSLESHNSPAISSKGKPAPSPVTASNRAESVEKPVPNGTAGVVSAVVPDSNKSSARSDNTTTPSLTPSATDSMKLLSKNKTDDQKTTSSPVASIMVNKKDEDLGSPLNYQRYDYAGDIYTMPSKAIISEKDNEGDENPIVQRMKQMVLEKARSNPSSPRAEVVNASRSSSFENGVYEEVTKITKVRRSEVIESVGPDGEGGQGRAGGQDTVDLLDGLVLPDILETDSKKKKDQMAPPAIPQLNKSRALSSSAVADTAPSVGTSNNDESGGSSPTSPVNLRSKDPISPRASETDDINKAGKRITASAFEFLEQYLSDDEGTETSHVDSPPMSPTGIKGVGDLVY